jgi:hypothetical protein
MRTRLLIVTVALASVFCAQPAIAKHSTHAHNSGAHKKHHKKHAKKTAAAVTPGAVVS